VSWPAKTALLCVFVVSNLGILWWRNARQEPEIRGVGPFVAVLGAAQAESVIAWRNAPSIPLDHQAISGFVERMKWKNCSPLSQKAITLTQNELSPVEQESLCHTLTSLLEAYSHSEPAKLYEFMTSIGEELPQSSIDTLRQLLTSSNNSVSSEDVATLSPRELWMTIAQRIHYNAHWQALVSDSACVTLWHTPQLAGDPFADVPLGELMSKEFRNETRFHHLFSWPGASLQNRIVADVRFVAKHDSQFMSEPSAYHVRLVLDPQTSFWHPVEMVHVPTVSGNSPPLLF